MKIRYALLLLILPVLLSAQDRWNALANAPNFIGQLSKLDDFHFIDADNGWTLNATGQVFKTTDGGQNWEEQADLDEFLRCVRFADENVGYIGSLQGSFGGPPSNSRLFKTEDGGDSWTDITDRISPEPIGICGLSVVDAQTIYGCGAFYSPARVYKSIDGGMSWTNIDMSAYAAALVDVHFFDADTGFVVGASNDGRNGGVILKTTDGGDNWQAVHQTMISSDLLWKIQALDQEYLYASIAGVSIDNGARILISDNGGDSWVSKQVDEGEVHLQGVGFITPTHGFAGGFFDGVYETKDGGDSWELIDVGANYNRFQKISDTLMYASGHTIYNYTREGITTSTGAELIEAPDYSMKVSPNPANDNLQIEYRLGQATHLDLGLYDSKGRKLISFFDGWHPEGTFNLNESIGQLPPGLYILGFLSREGDIIRKLLIER